jgi:hypothetical protein
MTATTASIYAQQGKLAFLAALANAAYRLRVDHVPGDGVNTTEVVTDNVNMATTALSTTARPPHYCTIPTATRRVEPSSSRSLHQNSRLPISILL